MPVYSLIAITRTAAAAATSKRICKEILSGGGVVCGIENWGTQPVAQPMYLPLNPSLASTHSSSPFQPQAQEVALAGAVVPPHIRRRACRLSRRLRFPPRRRGRHTHRVSWRLHPLPFLACPAARRLFPSCAYCVLCANVYSTSVAKSSATRP